MSCTLHAAWSACSKRMWSKLHSLHILHLQKHSLWTQHGDLAAKAGDVGAVERTRFSTYIADGLCPTRPRWFKTRRFQLSVPRLWHSKTLNQKIKRLVLSAKLAKYSLEHKCEKYEYGTRFLGWYPISLSLSQTVYMRASPMLLSSEDRSATHAAITCTAKLQL